MRKTLLLMAVLCALSINLSAQPSGDGSSGGGPGGSSSSGASTTYAYGTDITSLWASSSDYYYIVGLFYCSNPADESYEQMGIYVHPTGASARALRKAIRRSVQRQTWHWD